jgi:hypothetical protein
VTSVTMKDQDGDDLTLTLTPMEEDQDDVIAVAVNDGEVAYVRPNALRAALDYLESCE